MYERVWWYFRYRVGLWWMSIVQCKIINEIDIFQYVCIYMHLHVWKCASNDNKSGSLFANRNQKKELISIWCRYQFSFLSLSGQMVIQLVLSHWLQKWWKWIPRELYITAIYVYIFNDLYIMYLYMYVRVYIQLWNVWMHW